MQGCNSKKKRKPAATEDTSVKLVNSFVNSHLMNETTTIDASTIQHDKKKLQLKNITVHHTHISNTKLARMYPNVDLTCRM